MKDLSVHDLLGGENGVGDYQDMLIRISAAVVPSVPEPSTVMLVLGGCLLLLGLRRSRFRPRGWRLGS
jgi:hypothetical protein